MPISLDCRCWSRGSDRRLRDIAQKPARESATITRRRRRGATARDLTTDQAINEGRDLGIREHGLRAAGSPAVARRPHAAKPEWTAAVSRRSPNTPGNWCARRPRNSPPCGTAEGGPKRRACDRRRRLGSELICWRAERDRTRGRASLQRNRAEGRTPGLRLESSLSGRRPIRIWRCYLSTRLPWHAALQKSSG